MKTGCLNIMDILAKMPDIIKVISTVSIKYFSYIHVFPISLVADTFLCSYPCSHRPTSVAPVVEYNRWPRQITLLKTVLTCIKTQVHAKTHLAC